MLIPAAFLLVLQQPAVPGGLQEPPVAPEVLVTATGFAEDPLETPWSTTILDRRALRFGPRTLPEALARTPGVMVQKTAQGQSSPFIRGFTGFRTLMLVDGIRLNHAAMREGPNQYWSTVDPLLVERLEVVRGIQGVLYGSDAIGGTVNAVLRKADLGAPGSGFRAGGGFYGRAASAEESLAGRAEVRLGEGGAWGLLAGATGRAFSDLRAGGGRLPGTAYTDGGGDLRFDSRLGGAVDLTVGLQSFRQQDVPRTHKTVFAVPFHGTTRGSELRRDQDQVRDLAFLRASWEEAGGLFDTGAITLSLHHHDEERNRVRTGGKTDLQGFSLADVGLLARFESPEGDSGRWSWGFESHYETVNSFRRNFKNGVASLPPPIQGPVGDDAMATSLAAYMQFEQALGDFTLIPGLRITRNSVSADVVANPFATGPPAIGVANRWTALTGSLRGEWSFAGEARVFGGVSQGFRAPNVHDLTAFDATSAVELPNPFLDPEYFVQAEAGVKGRQGAWHWQASVYRTWIRDMITQTPTGAFVGTTPVVVEANTGDGWIHGLEAEVEWAFLPAWTLFLSGSGMTGNVRQIQPGSGMVVPAPLTRLAPLQATGGLRWEPPGEGFWVEVWVWAADKQDRLAFRDVTDTSRIPPGGTPGYAVFGLNAGWRVADGVTLGLAVENFTDQDYRVHGSGQNAPGVNAVGTLEIQF